MYNVIHNDICYTRKEQNYSGKYNYAICSVCHEECYITSFPLRYKGNEKGNVCENCLEGNVPDLRYHSTKKEAIAKYKRFAEHPAFYRIYSKDVVDIRKEHPSDIERSNELLIKNKWTIN
jgi:hypothetical protein